MDGANAVALQRQLADLRERFNRASDSFPPLPCLLIQLVAQTDGGEWVKRRLQERERLARLAAETYMVWTYGYQQPRCGLEGIIHPGLTRIVLIQGSKAALDRFAILSAEAGKCVAAIGSDVCAAVSRDLIGTDDPTRRWVYTVFDLAWRQGAGSLLTAPRSVCVDGHNVTYDPDGWRRFLQSNPSERRAWLISKSQLQELVDHPPECFCSEIADLVRASVHAIDLLSESIGRESDTLAGVKAEGTHKRDEQIMITVTAAAGRLLERVSGIDLNKAKARVSKAANDGKIMTNGRSRKARRLVQDSFSTWLLEQADKDLDRADEAGMP